MILSQIEQELVATEIRSFAASLSPDTRRKYDELAALVEQGSIPDERLDQLALILEIGLQTGRSRRAYGPDGEMALGKIFQRTPRGAASAAEASAVTSALRALKGQEIDKVRVSAVGPGAYSLLLDTRQCQITIRFDRSGVRVDNVAVGV